MDKREKISQNILCTETSSEQPSENILKPVSSPQTKVVHLSKKPMLDKLINCQESIAFESLKILSDGKENQNEITNLNVMVSSLKRHLQELRFNLLDLKRKEKLLQSMWQFCSFLTHQIKTFHHSAESPMKEFLRYLLSWRIDALFQSECDEFSKEKAAELIKHLNLIQNNYPELMIDALLYSEMLQSTTLKPAKLLPLSQFLSAQYLNSHIELKPKARLKIYLLVKSMWDLSVPRHDFEFHCIPVNFVRWAMRKTSLDIQEDILFEDFIMKLDKSLVFNILRPVKKVRDIIQNKDDSSSCTHRPKMRKSLSALSLNYSINGIPENELEKETGSELASVKEGKFKKVNRIKKTTLLTGSIKSSEVKLSKAAKGEKSSKISPTKTKLVHKSDPSKAPQRENKKKTTNDASPSSLSPAMMEEEISEQKFPDSTPSLAGAKCKVKRIEKKSTLLTGSTKSGKVKLIKVSILENSSKISPTETKLGHSKALQRENQTKKTTSDVSPSSLSPAMMEEEISEQKFSDSTPSLAGAKCKVKRIKKKSTLLTGSTKSGKVKLIKASKLENSSKISPTETKLGHKADPSKAPQRENQTKKTTSDISPSSLSPAMMEEEISEQKIFDSLPPQTNQKCKKVKRIQKKSTLLTGSTKSGKVKLIKASKLENLSKISPTETKLGHKADPSKAPQRENQTKKTTSDVSPSSLSPAMMEEEISEQKFSDSTPSLAGAKCKVKRIKKKSTLLTGSTKSGKVKLIKASKLENLSKISPTETKLVHKADHSKAPQRENQTKKTTSDVSPSSLSPAMMEEEISEQKFSDSTPSLAREKCKVKRIKKKSTLLTGSTKSGKVKLIKASKLENSSKISTETKLGHKAGPSKAPQRENQTKKTTSDVSPSSLSPARMEEEISEQKVFDSLPPQTNQKCKKVKRIKKKHTPLIWLIKSESNEVSKAEKLSKASPTASKLGQIAALDKTMPHRENQTKKITSTAILSSLRTVLQEEICKQKVFDSMPSLTERKCKKVKRLKIKHAPLVWSIKSESNEISKAEKSSKTSPTATKLGQKAAPKNNKLHRDNQTKKRTCDTTLSSLSPAVLEEEICELKVLHSMPSLQAGHIKAPQRENQTKKPTSDAAPSSPSPAVLEEICELKVLHSTPSLQASPIKAPQRENQTKKPTSDAAPSSPSPAILEEISEQKVLHSMPSDTEGKCQSVKSTSLTSSIKSKSLSKEERFGTVSSQIETKVSPKKLSQIKDASTSSPSGSSGECPKEKESLILPSPPKPSISCKKNKTEPQSSTSHKIKRLKIDNNLVSPSLTQTRDDNEYFEEAKTSPCPTQPPVCAEINTILSEPLSELAVNEQISNPSKQRYPLECNESVEMEENLKTPIPTKNVAKESETVVKVVSDFVANQNDDSDSDIEIAKVVESHGCNEIDEASSSDGDIIPCDENTKMFTDEETAAYHSYLKDGISMEKLKQCGSAEMREIVNESLTDGVMSSTKSDMQNKAILCENIDSEVIDSINDITKNDKEYLDYKIKESPSEVRKHSPESEQVCKNIATFVISDDDDYIEHIQTVQKTTAPKEISSLNTPLPKENLGSCTLESGNLFPDTNKNDNQEVVTESYAQAYTKTDTSSSEETATAILLNSKSPNHRESQLAKQFKSDDHQTSPVHPITKVVMSQSSPKKNLARSISPENSNNCIREIAVIVSPTKVSSASTCDVIDEENKSANNMIDDDCEVILHLSPPSLRTSPPSQVCSSQRKRSAILPEEHSPSKTIRNEDSSPASNVTSSKIPCSLMKEDVEMLETTVNGMSLAKLDEDSPAKTLTSDDTRNSEKLHMKKVLPSPTKQSSPSKILTNEVNSSISEVEMSNSAHNGNSLIAISQVNEKSPLKTLVSEEGATKPLPICDMNKSEMVATENFILDPQEEAEVCDKIMSPVKRGDLLRRFSQALTRERTSQTSPDRSGSLSMKIPEGLDDLVSPPRSSKRRNSMSSVGSVLPLRSSRRMSDISENIPSGIIAATPPRRSRRISECCSESGITTETTTTPVRRSRRISGIGGDLPDSSQPATPVRRSRRISGIGGDLPNSTQPATPVRRSRRISGIGEDLPESVQPATPTRRSQRIDTLSERW